MKKIGLLLLLVLLSLAAYSQESRELREYHAVRVNPHAPKIDGFANDPVWEKVPAAGDFVQHEPNQGEPATEKTWFKIAYDDHNIYVFIRAEESEPDKIKARLSRRDVTRNSDKVGIIIDSYFDHRTAFEFTVNAAGVQEDGVWTRDEEYDDRPNPVWESKTRIDDHGWSAEMRIPFSQIRFTEKDSYTWGLEVYRYIDRRKEYNQWQYISPDGTGFVSNFGILNGIEGVKAPKRMEILPYSLGKVGFDEAEYGNPFRPGHETTGAVGMDAKIGIGGNLTLDLTVNPDFGQVEADPSEVNLSAFESYFEEKRPFFVEGVDILSFPVGVGDGGMGLDNLFYSRRIGKAPYLHDWDFDSSDDALAYKSDDEYVKVPNETSILAAGKLTGKLDNGVSIGVMEAVTRQEHAKISDGKHTRSAIVEPLTNYSLVNLRKQFRQGQTELSAVATAVNRDIPNGTFQEMNKSAYTGGIRFNHEMHNRTYYVDVKLLGSRISGDPAAMIRAQRSSARYFQRPDAPHVSVDSSLTSMQGHAGSFLLGKGGNGKWRFMAATLWRSPKFEVNDLGFMREVDRINNIFWMGYRNRERVGIFQSINVNTNMWRGYNFHGDMLFGGGNINGHVRFINFYNAWGGIDRDVSALSVTALRGGPALKREGSWNYWLGLGSDSRKKVRVDVNHFGANSDDNISFNRRIRMGVNIELNHRFNVRISPSYSWRRTDLQYVTTIEADETIPEDHYIFARLNQHTWETTLRLDISLTPKLSIQYYGQPFISSGSYSNYKEITNPRANRYKDRFHEYGGTEIAWNSDDEEYDINYNGRSYSVGKYDFNYKQFNSNLVVRWEYRPGSTFYFVWSQEQSDYEEDGSFRPLRDTRELLSANPHAVFLVKFNYWFSV